MKENITEKIEMPSGVTITRVGSNLMIKGPKGEMSRSFADPKVKASVSGSTLQLSVVKATKREKAKLYSNVAHVKNMIAGVQALFVYKLKICSGHFPMNCTIANDVFTIKNFLGEKVPRTVKLRKGVSVKIDGTTVTVESVNIELAGQTAADIEHVTRISKRDLRIFQDGIYIVEKAGVPVEAA